MQDIEFTRQAKPLMDGTALNVHRNQYHIRSNIIPPIVQMQTIQSNQAISNASTYQENARCAMLATKPPVPPYS
jgi:hypothetical protein